CRSRTADRPATAADPPCTRRPAAPSPTTSRRPWLRATPTPHSYHRLSG
ncbi:MAG: hypothetical protein AVDCRST_MAG72-2515, partial [uncultured Nocardioidaceae bacterium]